MELNESRGTYRTPDDFEHASFRVRFQYFRKDSADPAYFDFNELLLNCHAKVEDEILFPRIEEALHADVQLRRNLGRISADHKLIVTLAGNMKKWADERKYDLLKERMKTYVDIVEFHNSQEEELVFPSWKEVDEKSRSEALAAAKGTIEGFGQQKYSQITGTSKSFLDTLAT